VTSLLLLLLGSTAGSSVEVSLRPMAEVAWPLAMLPQHCDGLTFVATNGFLMAALSLLPHSPNGTILLQSLLGYSQAQRISETFVYLFPILGLIAGQGWLLMPILWCLLVVNFADKRVPPPLEEASEPPQILVNTAYFALAAALLVAFPGPLHTLLGVSQASDVGQEFLGVWPVNRF